MAADGYRQGDDGSAPARVEILRLELAASRELLAHARAAHEGARGEIAGLRADIMADKTLIGRLRAEMRDRIEFSATVQATLQTDIVALREERTLILGSWSWRLTRPLRTGSRLIRAAAHRTRSLWQRLYGGARLARGRAAITRSGLFDAAWYRATYPDLAELRDPLSHYLTVGWRENRRPGPRFDPDYYRYANPDIVAAGGDPLSHYVLFGQHEGRDSRVLGAWRRPTPGHAGGLRETTPILPPGDADPGLPAPRIAVVVHAFYPDVFDSFCPLLAQIQGRFTLLVSTPSAEVRAAVEESIRQHGLDVDADVRVAQNRGRNFGPMLSEFSQQILRHDLLLHLHTKKSLHNAGGEQTAWRDDILAGLIGKDGVPASVRALFRARPEVGLVFTRTFPHMAYWANHWLQNTAQARAVYARLGVGDYNLRSYIDYPVGGMFWARVQAIAPLFSAGFTYEDFPPEAGQTDGTIAHAIERCLVDLARARGYTFAEADPAENLFRLGWSDKNLGRYELNTLDRLKTEIDKADLVSFDLFDTVLLRPSVSPDAVQRYVGLLLTRERPAAPDFYAARKAAEHAARADRKFEGDVGLDDIYGHMGRVGWPQADLDHARALETGVERAIVLTRPPLVEALRHAKALGKRTLAISDTYFSRADIEALLAAAGLDGLFDDIAVSSEQEARKDRGALWRKLIAREGVTLGQWLHVGDNEVSDMQQAGDLGIVVFHAMNPAVLLHLKGALSATALVAADEAHGMADALLLGPMTARLGADPYPVGGALGPARAADARALGYSVYGPALFAFSAWLTARPDVRALQRLYFLSREGWALQPLYDRLRRVVGEDVLPPSAYLHVSRRAVLMAAQAGGFDPQAVIDGPEFKGDLRGLLHARLGFDIPADAPVDLAMPIALPADAAAVRIALQALRPAIEAQAAREAAGLSAYLQQQGLTADARVGVVDVGYRATIQNGLQAALGRGLAGFYMATFPEAAQVAKTGGSATGYFGDAIDPLGDAPIVRHAILLEAVLTAPQGQLDHFDIDATGAAQPAFRADGRDAADLAVLAEVHRGMGDYADDLLRWYGPAIADLAFDPAAAFEPVAAFAHGRIQAPAAVIAALRVEDAYCGYDEHRLDGRLAFSDAD